MSTARVKSVEQVKSWEEVDDRLLGVARLQRGIDELEAELTERTAKLKEEFKAAVAERKRALKAEVKSVEVFVTGRREEMGKKKSRVLNHGTVGWRQSTKLALEMSSAEVIAALEGQGLGGCVKVKKSVDKTKLKDVEDETLERVGVKRVVEEVFFVEPEHVVIEPA